MNGHRILIRQLILLGLLLLGITAGVQAQDVVVPDLSGLNIPQAAAALNRAGLALGTQSVEAWSDTAAVPGGVASQGIAPGDSVAAGTAVDVLVYSNAKITLVYDDNDLTVINEAGESLPLNNLRFNSSDGSRQFIANRWRVSLPAGDCTQIWSIGRREPKAVAGCDSTYWLVTNDSVEHFWTQSAGVDSFNVIQDGAVRSTCPAAGPNTQNSPLRCEFYVVSGSVGTEATDYLYFAYTTDRLAVINRSDDRWMPLNETTIYNFNPRIQVAGASLDLGASSLFPDGAGVASTARLAPGQCLMFTVEPLSNAEPPQPCDLIAQRALSSEVNFWAAAFEMDSVLDGSRKTCPAPTAGQLTLCIMPR